MQKMRLRLPFCDLCALPHEFLVTGLQTTQGEKKEEEEEEEDGTMKDVLNIILTFLLAAFHVLHFGWLRFPAGSQTLTYAVQIIIDISLRLAEMKKEK